MGPPDAPNNNDVIQIAQRPGDRNSFWTHNRNKLNEALNIDNRIKINDYEIQNDTDYFLQAFNDRDADKSYKKGSFQTTRDFVQANLKNNGLSSIDERLQGSRFNF